MLFKITFSRLGALPDFAQRVDIPPLEQQGVRPRFGPPPPCFFQHFFLFDVKVFTCISESRRDLNKPHNDQTLGTNILNHSLLDDVRNTATNPRHMYPGSQLEIFVPTQVPSRNSFHEGQEVDIYPPQ